MLIFMCIFMLILPCLHLSAHPCTQPSCRSVLITTLHFPIAFEIPFSSSKLLGFLQFRGRGSMKEITELYIIIRKTQSVYSAQSWNSSSSWGIWQVFEDTLFTGHWLCASYVYDRETSKWKILFIQYFRWLYLAAILKWHFFLKLMSQVTSLVRTWLLSRLMACSFFRFEMVLSIRTPFLGNSALLCLPHRFRLRVLLPESISILMLTSLTRVSTSPI